jgi:hypothetical protein
MAKSTFPVELGLSDIKIKRVEVDRFGDYHIHVSCTVRQTRCSSCGKAISKSHGQCKASVIEHLPILDRRVFIHAKWPRFLCSDCDDKTTSFRPHWVNATGQMTVAYETFVLKCLIRVWLFLNKDTSYVRQGVTTNQCFRIGLSWGRVVVKNTVGHFPGGPRGCIT